MSEHKALITMLSSEKEELRTKMAVKDGETKILEDQIYEFVDEMGSKEAVIKELKAAQERSDYQRRELENRLVALEAVRR